MSERHDSRTARRRPADASRRADALPRYWPPALVVVLTFAVWELVIQVLDVPTYIWAPPSLIAADDPGELPAICSGTPASR